MKSDKTNISITWFSQFFGVDEPQYKLPFVDFSIHSDVPLYIDPYAITKDHSELAVHCHNAILSYFECLLSVIRAGEKSQIRQLIRGRLSEPREIHLGVSQVARRGRGIGTDQEQQIVNALLSSQAAKSGFVQAIQELELHVPGIGADKVSDLVANIILAWLAKFTESCCSEYGIATQPCAVNGFWNEERLEWDGGYFNLPVHGTNSYILVPRRFVRRQPDLMNHRYFYDRYILEVIQRDLITADDSLVKTLQNGERKVTKKSIKEDPRFTASKEYISQFIMEHPEVIASYRDEMNSKFSPVDPAVWSGKSVEDDPEIADALQTLDSLKPGRDDAGKYHHIVFTLVQFVFDWALTNFEIEYPMDQGRGRIDIIADNYTGDGLFLELRRELKASSIPIECKNYGTDLGNKEFDQLTDRLGPKTSQLGFLFCRTVHDEKSMLQHRSDRWLRKSNMILLIDDQILKELVNLRLQRNFVAIQDRLRKLIRSVEYNSPS